MSKSKRSYTIVWSDRKAGQAIPSNGTMIVRADGATDARDRFEARHPTYQVHGVFLGALVELLATYERETHYLGDMTPGATPPTTIQG